MNSINSHVICSSRIQVSLSLGGTCVREGACAVVVACLRSRCSRGLGTTGRVWPQLLPCPRLVGCHVGFRFGNGFINRTRLQIREGVYLKQSCSEIKIFDWLGHILGHHFRYGRSDGRFRATSARIFSPRILENSGSSDHFA